MIVEYTRYKIDEGRRTAFEHAYETAQEALQASSVCLGYELSHCTEAPEYYVLRIEWTSEEDHLKKFRSSPEFKPFLETVGPFFAAIEEMRHYAVTRIQAEKRRVAAAT